MSFCSFLNPSMSVASFLFVWFLIRVVFDSLCLFFVAFSGLRSWRFAFLLRRMFLVGLLFQSLVCSFLSCLLSLVSLVPPLCFCFSAKTRNKLSLFLRLLPVVLCLFSALCRYVSLPCLVLSSVLRCRAFPLAATKTNAVSSTDKKHELGARGVSSGS